MPSSDNTKGLGQSPEPRAITDLRPDYFYVQDPRYGSAGPGIGIGNADAVSDPTSNRAAYVGMSYGRWQSEVETLVHVKI